MGTLTSAATSTNPASSALPTADRRAPSSESSAGPVRRFDQPAYEVVARRYGRILDRLLAGGPDDDIDAGTKLFLRGLRHAIDAALNAPVDRIGSERQYAAAQLESLCNQCEYWLGPAAGADADRLPVRADPARLQPLATTDAELAMMALLWRLVVVLGWWRRPRWRLPAGDIGPLGLAGLRLAECLRRLAAAAAQRFRRAVRGAVRLVLRRTG
jgi:hypothetical protein